MTEEQALLKKRKKVWPFVIIGIVVIVAIGAWLGYDYYYNGPCGVKVVDEAIISIDDLYENYTDALDVAFATGRGQLAGPVMNLQEHKQDMDDVEVPLCLIMAKEAYSNSMDGAIGGFIAFMDADTPDSVVNGYFDRAIDDLERAEGYVEEVLECYPFCN